MEGRVYVADQLPSATDPVTGDDATTLTFLQRLRATLADLKNQTPPDDDPGDGGGTTTPGALLRIGPGAGLNHFKVQVSPEGAPDVVEHKQDEIAAGYAEDPVFTLNADETAVQFSVRMDGATTSGSIYPRSELRELNPDGSNIAFDPFTGDHYMTGRSRITHLPPAKPEVVVAQLHNGDADRIAIRTQVISGQTMLVVRVNGSAVTPRLAVPYILGTEFQWKIQVTDGVAHVFYEDMTTPVITSSALVPTSGGATWYFKAGAYAQSNETTDAPNETCAVELRDLEHWHTGWPAPAAS